MGLSSLTVKDLKAKLKSLGLAQTGRKQDLIDRIEEAEKCGVNGANGEGAVTEQDGGAQEEAAAPAAVGAVEEAATQPPAAEDPEEPKDADATDEGQQTKKAADGAVSSDGGLSMGTDDDNDARAPASANKTAMETPAAPAEESVAVPSGRADVAAPPAPAAPPPRDTATEQQATTKRKRAEIVFDPGSAAEEQRGSKVRKEKAKELMVEEADGATRALRIDGFRRPLREAELQAKLAETGCALSMLARPSLRHCASHVDW